MANTNAIRTHPRSARADPQSHKKTFQSPDFSDMITKLKLRMRYAKFKVDHNLIRHSLPEVESMWKHREKLRAQAARNREIDHQPTSGGFMASNGNATHRAGHGVRSGGLNGMELGSSNGGPSNLGLGIGAGAMGGLGLGMGMGFGQGIGLGVNAPYSMPGNSADFLDAYYGDTHGTEVTSFAASLVRSGCGTGDGCEERGAGGSIDEARPSTPYIAQSSLNVSPPNRSLGNIKPTTAPFDEFMDGSTSSYLTSSPIASTSLAATTTPRPIPTSYSGLIRGMPSSRPHLFDSPAESNVSRRLDKMPAQTDGLSPSPMDIQAPLNHSDRESGSRSGSELTEAVLQTSIRPSREQTPPSKIIGGLEPPMSQFAAHHSQHDGLFSGRNSIIGTPMRNNSLVSADSSATIVVGASGRDNLLPAGRSSNTLRPEDTSSSFGLSRVMSINDLDNYDFGYEAPSESSQPRSLARGDKSGNSFLRLNPSSKQNPSSLNTDRQY